MMDAEAALGAAMLATIKPRPKRRPWNTTKPIPAPVEPFGPYLPQRTHDIRTLYDHFMSVADIAAHYGMTKAEVCAELGKTKRVRRVM